MKLYLYRISQSVVSGYDTYDSAVVCAANEDEARSIHPGGFDVSWGSGSWPLNTNKVKVDLIGLAFDHVEPGVICASFNAG